MALRYLVYITGVAALVFSLGDILVPALQAGLVAPGTSLSPYAVGAIQLRGAVGLLYTFLAYFAKNADDETLRRVIGPTMMLGFVAQSLAILYLLFTGVMNSTGWIFIVLGIIFISAYVYLLYVRPSAR
jgi:hypothetical protein